MTLHDRTDEEWKGLLGKRAEAISKGKRIVGILEFAGINEVHGHYQVTLSRCPYWPVKKQSIKLIK